MNKNKGHLPMFGVGTIYVCVIIAATAAGIAEYEEYCRRVNRCIPWLPKKR